MKLYEIIESNNWLSVELTLLRLYPDQKTMLEEYRMVFEKLNQINISESPRDLNKDDEMSIVLTEYDCDPSFENEQENYVDVSGRKKVEEKDTIPDCYALEFVEWKKWLVMDLSKETIENFSELEIIVHCLYEMTFIDYDENIIKDNLYELNNRIEEYEKLTEEEKKLKTISIDEFKRRFDNKDKP